MTVRLLTISDYDDIYSLWLSCSGMGLNDIDDSSQGVERFLKRNPETCFVSVENDADGESVITGVIMAGNDGRSVRPLFDGCRGYIYHTAVRPEYRHRGIASELVNKAVSALEARGIAKAALLVFGRNTGANAFWEKMGFTERNDIIYRNKSLTEIVRIDT